MLLEIILKYDTLGRDALGKGADMNDLFDLPSREQIGRAKYVSAEEYEAAYQKIDAQMEDEIAKAVEAGGKDL